jgi:hypothetical protein
MGFLVCGTPVHLHPESILHKVMRDKNSRMGARFYIDPHPINYDGIEPK